MKKKIQIKFLKQTIVEHTFTRDQIEHGDISEFIKKFGDAQLLGSDRIKNLFGKLVLKFEGIEEGSVATNLKVRVLLRRLHKAWPWAGFFLNLETPLGPTDAFSFFPLLALGLCTADIKIGTWDTTGKTIIRIGSEIHHFKNVAHMVVEHYRKKTTLSNAVMQQRHTDIEKQFTPIHI